MAVVREADVIREHRVAWKASGAGTSEREQRPGWPGWPGGPGYRSSFLRVLAAEQLLSVPIARTSPKRQILRAFAETAALMGVA